MITVPALKADGFDDAILGMVTDMRNGQQRVVYDSNKCIEILANAHDKDGLSWEEAEEFFSFNVVGAYMGEGTPLFMYPYDEDTINEEFSYEDVEPEAYTREEGTGHGTG